MRVLACISGVGRGHAARCRPLLEELAGRGHSCVAAVAGRRAAGLLDGVCPTIVPDAGFASAVAPARADPAAYMLVYDLEHAIAVYQRDVRASTAAVVRFVDSAIDETRPDVVIVDQLLPAAAVARARGGPVVQITHGPVTSDAGRWAAWMPERPAELRIPPVLGPVNEALAAAEIEPLGRLAALLEGDLVIVPGPPALGTTSGALHVDLPAILPNEEPAPLERGDRPLVAVLFGSAPQQLADAVRGVLDAGADAVVVEGATGGVELDPRATVIGRVDPRELFGSVDAVVHHGGAGSAVECLRAGVPSLGVPLHTEQEFNVRRLETAGAAILVPAADTPLEPLELRDGLVTLGHRRQERLSERSAEALTELLAGTHREAAARGALLVSELPRADAAADAVEALAR